MISAAKNCGILVWLVAIAALACFGGCGGSPESTHKVSGTVTYQGQPLPNITVIFTPEGDAGSGRPATAITDAGGKFSSATTYKSGDGVLPGKHKVTLAKAAPDADSTDLGEGAYGAEDTSTLPFPVKYLNTMDSDVTVDVTSSGQELDIQLTD